MCTGLHTSPEQSSSHKTNVFETIGPDVFQLDEVQRNVGFDYNDLNTPIQIVSTNFLPLVTHLLTLPRDFPCGKQGCYSNLPAAK